MVMCAIANAEYHVDTSADNDLDMDIDTFLAGGFEKFADGDAVTHSRHSRGTLVIKREKRVQETKSTKSTIPAKKSGSKMQANVPNPGNAPSTVAPSLVEQELTSHKAQLEALRTADPEFYQYLVESDKALLNFSDDEDDVDCPAHAARTDGMEKPKKTIIAMEESRIEDSPAADCGYSLPSGVHLQMFL